ncbi:hypothetical protein [Desulfoluna sp.]|uniref:hypothetical protein n=1 Tax=Desulfoluna sp. TaxID=2045199 RepID=UPI002635A511|nr:hypothetical protein [Desulfoluna sp.]
MNARNYDHLLELMRENPDATPSTFLEDSSYSSWLYDHSDVRRLKSAMQGDPEPGDLQRWDLSPGLWREQVAMALGALKRKK